MNLWIVKSYVSTVSDFSFPNPTSKTSDIVLIKDANVHADGNGSARRWHKIRHTVRIRKEHRRNEWSKIRITFASTAIAIPTMSSATASSNRLGTRSAGIVLQQWTRLLAITF